MDPAGFVTARGIPGQCGPCGGVGTRDEAKADEHLEAVADTHDESAAIDESREGVAQTVADLVGEDATAGDVVAVAEAAGDRDDLEPVEGCRGFDESFDVRGVSRRAGLLPGEGGLLFAVNAGGPDDEDAYLCHGGIVPTERWDARPGDAAFFDSRRRASDNSGV